MGYSLKETRNSILTFFYVYINFFLICVYWRYNGSKTLSLYYPTSIIIVNPIASKPLYLLHWRKHFPLGITIVLKLKKYKSFNLHEHWFRWNFHFSVKRGVPCVFRGIIWVCILRYCRNSSIEIQVVVLYLFLFTFRGCGADRM